MSTVYWRRSSASRYSGNDSQSHGSPSASAVPGMSSTPSSMPISQSCCSGVGLAGANPTPQLPIATDVTPWRLEGASIGSHVAWPSKWVWMSTKPGVTTSPSASMTSAPARVEAGADLGDHAVADGDVGMDGRGAGAVDDEAVADDERARVTHGVDSPRADRTQGVAVRSAAGVVGVTATMLRGPSATCAAVPQWVLPLCGIFSPAHPSANMCSLGVPRCPAPTPPSSTPTSTRSSPRSSSATIRRCAGGR